MVGVVDEIVVIEEVVDRIIQVDAALVVRVSGVVRKRVVVA